MSNNNVVKITAGIAAGVALAFGAWALGSAGSSSNQTASAATGRTAGPPGMNGQAPNGQAPPGFGIPVTGAAATKVKNAALAKYSGTVEHVMKLPDGSYVVHVITSSGEVHVRVSKSFQVTGIDQGGPPGPQGTAPRPQGGAPATVQ
jgi:hypothetical protein